MSGDWWWCEAARRVWPPSVGLVTWESLQPFIKFAGGALEARIAAGMQGLFELSDKQQERTPLQNCWIQFVLLRWRARTEERQRQRV